jgi:hypothetical protein
VRDNNHEGAKTPRKECNAETQRRSIKSAKENNSISVKSAKSLLSVRDNSYEGAKAPRKECHSDLPEGKQGRISLKTIENILIDSIQSD